MPPKASSVSVGRPRAAASEDPAIELKRQKAREAAAKYRAKKASAISSVSTAAPSTAPVNKQAPNKSLLKGFVEDKESKAKGVLSRAIQAKKARAEMRGLKADKLQANAIKRMEQLGIKKGDEFILPITLPYKDFRTLLIQQYPEEYNFIKKKEREKKSYGETIKLLYKPYRSYDYFCYMYKDTDGSMKKYPMKIDIVDEDYSTYLQNKFWRIDYWTYRASLGEFPYDVSKKAEIKDSQYFQDELFLEMYPVPNFEVGSPPPSKDHNQKLIGKREDDFFDDIAYRRDKKRLDKYYAPIYKTKTEVLDLGTRDRLTGVKSAANSPMAKDTKRTNSAFPKKTY